MKVPFLDLKKQYKSIKPFIDKRIQNVINSQQFINGKQVKEFERRFANLVNKKYCVAVGNGTDGLFLTYKAYGMNCGWNVLSVPNTFIATTETISATGANLYFTDVKEDGLIDVSKFSKDRIISAVVPVHLYGNPCDMDEIFEFARKNEAIVIEDCAQAHLAEYAYQKVPLSETGVFSFFPGKNIGSFGDSGAVVTNNKEIAEKIAMLRDHGRNEKYKSQFEGYNSRMDELQAAVLIAKLKFIKGWTLKRQKHAKTYTDLIADYNLPIIPPSLDLGKTHVFHLYVIRCKEREKLRAYLMNKGIQTGIHYPYPLHKQDAYKRFSNEKYPVAEQLSKEILSLPMFPELKDEQIKYVVDNIRGFYKC